MQALAETVRAPMPFIEQLTTAAPADLANQARERGDAKRGALVFYTTTASCIHCHTTPHRSASTEATSRNDSPLGPDLATIRKVSDTHLVESLLYPSKVIHKDHETKSILTTSGELVVALVTSENEDTLTVRSANDLDRSRVISKNAIEAIKTNTQSMMPEGLVATIGNLRDFLDLTLYLIEIAEGGTVRAEELMPSSDQLEFKDDTLDLGSRGHYRQITFSRDFETGKGIFHGYCFNCHGNDGNSPSLPTARAFGTDKMRFGSDPFQMFMTLSKGKGLMAAMRHLNAQGALSSCALRS